MKKNRLILLAEPYFDYQERENLIKAIDSGWVSSLGPFVKQFEKDFAKFCNRKYSLAVHSGTAALHLALIALGIGKGDEIIIPNLTYIATANAVTYTGAKPVLVDVDYETGNIDYSLIESKITKKTKAIIPVHLFGNPCDMNQINKIAKKHSLWVIEDAAEAHGATYQGKIVGSLSNIACFSFYGNKTITTGEGGMLVSNHKKSIQNAFTFANQGRSEKNHYLHPVLGYNYRMTNLQAALGVAQIRKIGYLLKRKKEIYNIYKNEFEGNKNISFFSERKGNKSSFWMSTILIKKGNNKKEALIRHLKKNGIQTMHFFTPINQQPIYRSKEIFKASEQLFKEGLILPSSVRLDKNQIIKVSKNIREYLE